MAIRVLILILLVLVGAIAYVMLFRPAAAPWVPSGRLVVVAYAVPEPGAATSTVLGVGIDDIMLSGIDADTRASLVTRRVTLNSSSIVQKRLLESTVPVGSYDGVSFVLKSPELRNAWQEDSAPERVMLQGETVSVKSSFTVTEGATTVLMLGFETLSALHRSDVAYTYLPVVHLEARNSATLVDVGDNIVRIEGGVIDTSETWGMDQHGTMRLNYRERKAIDQQAMPEVEPLDTPPAPEVADDTSTTTAATSTEKASSSTEEISTSSPLDQP